MYDVIWNKALCTGMSSTILLLVQKGLIIPGKEGVKKCWLTVSSALAGDDVFPVSCYMVDKECVMCVTVCSGFIVKYEALYVWST